MVIELIFQFVFDLKKKPCFLHLFQLFFPLLLLALFKIAFLMFCSFAPIVFYSFFFFLNI